MCDSEIVKAALEFREGILPNGNPDLMCAAVSWALQGFLSFAMNIESECREVHLGSVNHIFLVLPDGRVLDATADQFNSEVEKFPPVYLGAPLRIHRSNKAEV